MNIATASIRKSTVTWFITGLLLVGGLLSYTGLGKLEDPAFTIKTAVVATRYPGASPEEVENEVTEVVESAIQQLGQVDIVRSLSQAGGSVIYVDIKDTFTAKDLPQIWDELRRKVNDVQGSLPPGAGPSLVNDDYGDVFGVYFALTGKGYSLRELENFADFLRKELLLVPGVANVRIAGVQRETVYVELSRSRMTQLGIPLQTIFDTLKAQNLVVDAGSVQVGKEYLRIEPTGLFATVEDIGDLFLRSGAGTLLRLRDVATVKRGYLDPPQALMRFNGEPALGIGISNVEGGNVITMGEAVKKRLAELLPQTPLGMELGLIYYQSDTVKEAIANFLVNLLEALVIVIGLLLLFMGMRCGLLIGAVLLLTILATFIAMRGFHIDLHSISLGALIIALGMLVDNAIVVADGVLVGIQKGRDPFRSSEDIVGQTQWPLLGATIIAVLAFAPIGLSPDSTGEYCRSLFQVVGISLLLSWVLAVTITPLAGAHFLKVAPMQEGEELYGSLLYRLYRKFLETCLAKRLLTLAVLAGLLVTGIIGFGMVDKSFFPSASSPMFTIEFRRPKGAFINETLEDVRKFETFLREQPETKSVTSFVGEGALRFLLTFTAGDPGDEYGSFVVGTENAEETDSLMKKVEDFAARDLPYLDPRVRPFGKGTGSGAKIQVRFSGEDPLVLRSLADQATALYRAAGAVNIRSDWGERVKVIRPVLDEVRARQAGLTRKDIAEALELSFSGATAGLYREKDKLLPIVARFPETERADAGTLPEVQAWSPSLQRYLLLSQVVRRFDTVAEDSVIYRRNRMRTVTTECDAADGLAGPLFTRVRSSVENLPLPLGYSMEWGGEYESSGKAQGGLLRMIPLAFAAMALILVVLFNALRQPAIILLCLPLSVIGMTAGLLLLRKPFDFLALLGFLSLAGMLIKNAIVLIDQVDLEIREGRDPYEAIVDSALSRARPVLMAALTTVLGMVPLYFDVLFSSMAVTIMFGLTFATGLTLVVVPVLYALFFRIHPAPEGKGVPG
jgi:multidrug efflux pump subunit AcrB